VSDDIDVWIVADPPQDYDQSLEILGVYASEEAARAAIPLFSEGAIYENPPFCARNCEFPEEEYGRYVQIQHWRGPYRLSVEKVVDLPGRDQLKGAISRALLDHRLPDGRTVTVRDQADAVLRLLDDNGYRIVSKTMSDGLHAARSATSALSPKQAISWALTKHEMPDDTTWMPLDQAEDVLRHLDMDGYRVVAKEES